VVYKIISLEVVKLATQSHHEAVCLRKAADADLRHRKMVLDQALLSSSTRSKIVKLLFSPLVFFFSIVDKLKLKFILQMTTPPMGQPIAAAARHTPRG
jgi:hypothetical protein